ncbi:MAG TPA: DUF2298 domain-containing protein [Thermoanaerobaculaceae bacterium]|nr:DUF2298 domain-containing protein [Thermoanaerobaculaceae bacterium]HPS78290.1 DUF2298 domain-containing protein [Thermoanaerobaculaceae bacterium]
MIDLDLETTASSSRHPSRRASLALVLLALVVRLFGIGWDGGSNFHPDERRIAEAVVGMSFVPLQLNPHFFAYGSFPLYLTRAACSLLRPLDPWLAGYDGAIRVGRALSALWGAGAVWLLFLLGRKLFGESEGLLAAGLLAICVLPVQNAHFATNDIPLSTLVLLALYLAGRALDGGRLRTLAGAGMVTGLALATKVSALPLLLPLALVALLRWWPSRDWRRWLGWGMTAGTAAALGFAIGQPYALLDSRAFLHDVVEQSQMVRHAGLLPYTNQYVGVSKGVYDLHELVTWGMGPALGLVALAGLGIALVRTIRRRRAGEGLLLAWAIPFAVITMSFDVKFPRYLLPVYPLLILWAAVALHRWARSRLGRWVRAGVVAATALYLLAFLSIYLRPHTVRAASEWFYAHVPAGSRVLSQDWDEGFPQNLPGRSSEIFKVVTFPFYEPDNPAKAASLAHEVAAADFIALQTKRIYGATTRAHDRFPLTSNFFYLLFAGDLGFEPLVDFTSRPALAGVELPTELADESFSVYDHPKVLIFSNVARLDATELERRIRCALPSHPITRDQMLLTRANTPAGSSGLLVRSSWLAVFLAVALVELLGLAAWILLASALGENRLGLWALAKPVGVLLAGLGCWWAVSTGWLPFTAGTVLGIGAILVVAAALTWHRARPAPSLREVVVSEVVVWGCFALFLGFRLLNPEIYWGEKPMDFSFLNTLYRTTTLPPPEPWFSGSALHYTYFGHFLVAAAGKATAIPPEIMFNLGIGLVAALLAAATLAAGTLIGGRLATGSAAVALCMLVGNLSAVRELIARRSVDFDYFWAMSRVIPNTINEFPWWNLVFADLHAHVLAMPWALTLVALLVLGLVPTRPVWRVRALLWALAAAALAAIMITNGWSTPTYLVLVTWLALVAWLGEIGRARGWRKWLRAAWSHLVLPTLVVVGGAVLLTQPFWRHFRPPPRSWGWEVGPYALPVDVLTVFGLAWAIIVPVAGLLWWRARVSGRPQRWRVGLAAGLGLAMLLTVVDLSALATGHLRLAVSVAPLAAVLFLVLLVGLREAPAPARLPLALAVMATGMVLGCELVFVWDRMNTIFKFYLDAWLLLAVAAAGVAEVVLAQRRWPGRVWRLGLGAGLAVAGFGAISGAWGAVTHRHTPGPRWTLDGTAYLSARSPDEKAAFDWLNRNVPGTPVLVEAAGPSYQEFGRVSMNTGLPIVLGWEYHVFQRSQSQTAIDRRRQDVEVIYTSPSKTEVNATLSRYHVALVFVGNLERQTYRGANLLNFRTWSDLLVPLYESSSVSIFGVRDNLPGRFPLTARDAAEEAPGDVQAPPGRLREPRGVSCDRSGNAVVADFSNHRIQVLASDGTAVAVWGRKGSAPGEMQEPTDVAVGPDGSIFVADTWNGRVQVFDSGGRYLREWAGDFYGPRGIAVGPDGSVWVADTGNHRIVHFDPNGHLLGGWGKRGGAPGELFEPMGVAIDRSGNLVVCDSGNGRVQVFAPDGALRAQFRVPDWRREVYSEPHVAVDPWGRLWVTVPLAHEIRAYSAAGDLLAVVSGASLQPPLQTPVGIAVDPTGRSLVVTEIADRLRRLPLPPPPRAARPGDQETGHAHR